LEESLTNVNIEAPFNHINPDLKFSLSVLQLKCNVDSMNKVLVISNKIEQLEFSNTPCPWTSKTGDRMKS
jgi:hypothetical protein